MQWKKNTVLIDANVILRYLLNDSSEMSEKAREIIAAGGAYAKPEIIAEVVYVLKRVYSYEKTQIRIFIRALLDDISCTDSPCVLLAVDLYAENALDFVDCLLIAYQRLNHETVFTFDKKLNRHLSNDGGNDGAL